jgi:hypothetical protein
MDMCKNVCDKKRSFSFLFHEETKKNKKNKNIDVIILKIFEALMQ